MNRRHSLWVTIGGGLFLVISLTLWLQYEYDRYPRAYARLARGTSKRDVLRQFGTPEEVTKCMYAPSWDGEPLDEKSTKCIEEFSYYSHLRIGQWVIGFDENGKVITKGYLSSP